MQKLSIVTLAVWLISSLQAQSWYESLYFDTKFLLQYDKVREQLITQDGFQEGFFATADQVAINYYWLQRPQARYTMILASGFLPGRKEGILSFYAMLPDDCNLLFFDARGHGKSTGNFLSRIWQYGRYEYLDAIAAIEWTKQHSDCPIVLFGMCSGAFHMMHAVLHLSQQEIKKYDIRGLIFDSGWRSVTEIAKTALQSILQESVMKKLKKLLNNTALYEHQTYYSLALNKSLSFLHSMVIKPALSLNKQETDLQDKIAQLSIPVLYIHAQDDTFALIGPVKSLAARTPKKQTWWIKQPSKHACHHLKHKKAYREHVLRFINAII